MNFGKGALFRGQKQGPQFEVRFPIVRIENEGTPENGSRLAELLLIEIDTPE
jgi:hypothetical protein